MIHSRKVFYVLNEDHTVREATDIHEVELLYSLDFLKKRIVKKTKINGVEVSTVFLGINHRFINDGPPILFETMIFRHDGIEIESLANYQTRCCTWDEALEMHEAGIKMANNVLLKDYEK